VNNSINSLAMRESRAELKKRKDNVKIIGGWRIRIREGGVDVNLREQEYICAVARCRSITKAAMELNVTQAALSLFVQNVEKRLGVALFERYKKEMIPTQVGEVYIEYARRILTEGEAFEEWLRDYFQKGKGRIRFGINSKRSPLIVPQLLLKMRELYPGVEVSVKESDTLQLSAMLQNDELDCIYSYEKIQNKVIHSEFLNYDRVGLILSSDYPVLKNIHYDRKDKNKSLDLQDL